MNSFRTMLTLTAAAALALGAGACTNVDRAGGKAADPETTLTFAQGNDGNPPAQLQAWATQVEQASDGSLKIAFQNGWRLGETDSETGTITDVANGEVDLAWVGARAFDRVGVTDFQALLAPMLVDSHELQRAVFEEGIAEEMLAGVEEVGVTGLGVLPGPMRKVLGIDKPFLEPDDFRGAVVGMQDSALTQASMETLGATTKAEPSGAELDGLDAYEQQLSSISGNAYVNHARYVTGNLDLWPRPLVLFANPDVFEGLSDEQQAALIKAGQDAVPTALDASRAEDEEGAEQLCKQGMLLVESSGEQLDALTTAWEPVYDDLAGDEDTAGWLDRIRALKGSLGAGPDTARCEPSTSSPREGVLPNGTYETTLTVADIRAGCKPGDPGAQNLASITTDQTLEMVIDGDRVTQTQHPVGHPEQREPGWIGTYRAFRDTFELLETGSATPLVSTYAFDGRRLLLTDMKDDYCDNRTVWTGHPWTLVEESSSSDELIGTWTTELVADDWSTAGFDGPTGTWTIAFADGSVTLTAPDGEIGYQATYSAFRGRLVTSESTDELHVAYRIDGDKLHFTEVTVSGSADAGPYGVVWASHPWTRQVD